VRFIAKVNTAQITFHMHSTCLVSSAYGTLALFRKFFKINSYFRP